MVDIYEPSTTSFKNVKNWQNSWFQPPSLPVNISNNMKLHTQRCFKNCCIMNIKSILNQGWCCLYLTSVPHKGTKGEQRSISSLRINCPCVSICSTNSKKWESRQRCSDITDRNQSKQFTVQDWLILPDRIELPAELSLTVAMLLLLS